MATKKAKAVEQSHHFYASTAYDWRCGQTREAVLKGLAAGYAGMLKKGSKGIEVVICRVELPESATYTIRNYVPFEVTTKDAEGNCQPTGQRVPLSQYERLLIKDAKGYCEKNPEAPPVPTDEELAACNARPVTEQERRRW